tara:strand:+ start:4809 stop:5783 length:975 start_codon:yes stop_codon:yes gene_type:complete
MATYESRKYAIIPITATQIADGTVTDSEFQFINTLASNAQTQITARLPSAGGTMTGNLEFGDSVEARFGNSDDLRILHDGNNSQLKDTGAGALEILTDEFKVKNAADSETMILANENGSVAIYHDNTARVTTSGSGATINGTLSATTVSATTGSFTNVSGNGSSLTSIPAGNLTGTVADARLSTVSSSKLSGALPAIDGSALTGIASVPASGSAVGAILEFQFRSTNGGMTASSISAGTTVTFPYTSGNMQLRTGSGVVTSGTISGGAAVGRGIVGGMTGGSSYTGAGTWRCLTFTQCGTFQVGSGQNAFNQNYSVPGLFQRIS